MTHQIIFSLLLAGTCLCLAGGAEPSAAELSPLVDATQRLLSDGNTGAFLVMTSPVVDDLYEEGRDRKELADGLRSNAEYSTKSLQWFLERTREIGIDLSLVTVEDVRVISCKRNPHGDDFIDEMVIGFKGVPASAEAEPLRGEYRLMLKSIKKYSSGWKLRDGIHWVSVPGTVAAPERLKEFYIMESAASFGPLSDEVDPSLQKLGEVAVGFMKSGDVFALCRELLQNSDQRLKNFARVAESASLPASVTNLLEDAQIDSEEIRALVEVGKVMKQFGLSFPDAEIRVDRVSLDSVYTVFGNHTLDGLHGEDLQVELLVKTDAKGGGGQSLSGQYVLAADRTMRWDGRWYVAGKLRWYRFPEGAVDRETKAAVELENHLVKYKVLPLGAPVADFELTRASDGSGVRFDTLKGNVLLLHIWPSWLLSSNNDPMEPFLQLLQEHPAWADQVRLVSINGTNSYGEDSLRAYIVRQPWKNIDCFFVDEMKMEKTPLRLNPMNLPICYIIDQEGKVAAAGHPRALDVAGEVNRLIGR